MKEYLFWWNIVLSVLLVLGLIVNLEIYFDIKEIDGKVNMALAEQTSELNVKLNKTLDEFAVEMNREVNQILDIRLSQ
ncbi:hypothetical protein ACFLVH_00545 [Chloroflexota bacterium]